MQHLACALAGCFFSGSGIGRVPLMQVTNSLHKLAYIIIAERRLHGGQRRIGKERPVQCGAHGLQGQYGALITVDFAGHARGGRVTRLNSSSATAAA